MLNTAPIAAAAPLPGLVSPQVQTPPQGDGGPPFATALDQAAAHQRAASVDAEADSGAQAEAAADGTTAAVPGHARPKPTTTTGSARHGAMRNAVGRDLLSPPTEALHKTSAQAAAADDKRVPDDGPPTSELGGQALLDLAAWVSGLPLQRAPASDNAASATPKDHAAERGGKTLALCADASPQPAASVRDAIWRSTPNPRRPARRTSLRAWPRRPASTRPARPDAPPSPAPPRRRWPTWPTWPPPAASCSPATRGYTWPSDGCASPSAMRAAATSCSRGDAVGQRLAAGRTQSARNRITLPDRAEGGAGHERVCIEPGFAAQRAGARRHRTCAAEAQPGRDGPDRGAHPPRRHAGPGRLQRGPCGHAASLAGRRTGTGQRAARNGLTLTGGGVFEQPREPRGEARRDCRTAALRQARRHATARARTPACHACRAPAAWSISTPDPPSAARAGADSGETAVFVPLFAPS